MGRGTLCGTWHQPRPIFFMQDEDEGEGFYINEEKTVKLRVEDYEKEGKHIRKVYMDDLEAGFTMTGRLNVRNTRVAWDNGAVWAKQHGAGNFVASGSKTSAALSTNDEEVAHAAEPKVVLDDPAHEAAPWWSCGGAPRSDEDIDDEPAQPACCSFRFRRAPAQAPPEEGPEDSQCAGKVLPVEILSARGLRNTDLGGSANLPDFFCVCEIVDRPGSIVIRTPIVRHSLNPKWNHSDELHDYVVGDSLMFTVYDKDTLGQDMAGKVILTSDQFHPDGFEGDVQLTETGGVEAYVTLDIAPAEEMRARKALLSPDQVEDIVSSVNNSFDVFGMTEGMEAYMIRKAVHTVNRRLRKALLTFADRGWVNCLQVLLDDATERDEKEIAMADCLDECFRDPLAKALTDLVVTPGSFGRETVAKMNVLIVDKVVETLVDMAIDGLQENRTICFQSASMKSV